jgi:proteasome accessory factor B
VTEARWHPSQKLTAQRDGSLLAEFMLNSTEEIKSWVLSFGVHAVVLEPSTLRDEMRAEIQSMLGLYETSKEDVSIETLGRDRSAEVVRLTGRARKERR